MSIQPTAIQPVRLAETITTPAAYTGQWNFTPSGWAWCYLGTRIAVNTVTPWSVIEWGNGSSTVGGGSYSVFQESASGIYSPNTTYTVAVSYTGPLPPGFIFTPSGQCIRRAWLTLQQASTVYFGVMDTVGIELHNPSRGWVCDTLDLGYPEVRAVMNNRPDQDGVDDRTKLWGSRAISADIVVSQSWGARIDEVADNFAPFMLPNRRPTLHYILDRGDNPERTITVRPANYEWKIDNDAERFVHLSFVASDPIVRSATQNIRTAWAGSSTAQGRTYNLTFPRVYPAGGGTGGNVLLQSGGDTYFYPLYRIYGPITGPRVTVNVHDATVGSGITSYIRINFLATFTLGAGEWVDVDSATKTAFKNSNRNMSVQANIDWNSSTWGGIPPNPSNGSMGLSGSSTTGVTQVQAMWYDGYIS